MNKLILLLFAIVSLSAHADMGDLFYIKIQLEFKDGRKEIRSFHTSTSLVDQDSLKHPSYLLNKMPYWVGYRDSLHLFKDWVSFYCYNPWSSDDSMINTIGLSHLEKIPVKTIKSYKLIEVQRRPVGPGIYNKLTESDQKWMNGKPIAVLKTYAELCEFDIYIFEQTEETKQFIKKLEAANALNKSFGEEQEVYELLETIGKKKIVVVQFCSC